MNISSISSIQPFIPTEHRTPAKQPEQHLKEKDTKVQHTEGTVAISARLRSEKSILHSLIQENMDDLAVIDAADAGLHSLSQTLIQMRGSFTATSTTDKEQLATLMKQLQDKTSKVLKPNNIYSSSLQNKTYTSLSSSLLFLQRKNDPYESLADLNSALHEITSARTQLQGAREQIEQTMTFLTSASSQIDQFLLHIEDADQAKEVSETIKKKLLAHHEASSLSQANHIRTTVAALLSDTKER